MNVFDCRDELMATIGSNTMSDLKTIASQSQNQIFDTEACHAEHHGSGGVDAFIPIPVWSFRGAQVLLPDTTWVLALRRQALVRVSNLFLDHQHQDNHGKGNVRQQIQEQVLPGSIAPTMSPPQAPSLSLATQIRPGTSKSLRQIMGVVESLGQFGSTIQRYNKAEALRVWVRCTIVRGGPCAPGRGPSQRHARPT